MKSIRKYFIIFFSLIIFNSCGLIDPDGGGGMPEYVLINEIHIIDNNGSNHKILTQGWNSQFLNNSNKIAFKIDNDLFEMNLADNNAKIIRSFTSLWDYTVSENGEKFLLTIATDNSVSIYGMDSDGSNYIRLTDNGNRSIDRAPVFSDKMDKIAFQRNFNIYLMNNDGTNLKRITNRFDSVYYYQPYFVDNDKQIIYFEEKKNNYNFQMVHLYNLEEKHDSILMKIKKPFYSKYIDVSKKDGTILFFQNIQLAEDSIKTLNLSTGVIKNIAVGHYAAFSPDGEKIVYSNGNTIYTINCNGGSNKLIFTENEEGKWVYNVKFSPDNSKIIFEVQFGYEKDY